MNDFKLKLVLSVLSGVLFSFIFIILALVLPVKDTVEPVVIKKPQGKLEQIAESMKNR